ncbi:helix-turn-helix domain-containing protein [Streptomyces sp. SID3343]|uniref:ArsR/SmtB family transcription factor n=1 Tax=Streptomyces sp. SID3343 TaxID=2690260 RepID=UPI001369A6D2|nr:helix-turn-helix domain-containing protein [Streptomyces sp. SID3343]MYV97702.1 helix-turn-helix domain-containing protein [Streptomyces sp. SID3343]
MVTPPDREIRELAALKALAHPRRQLVMRELQARGPATSASLARALDLNTGATSYHLRELARHGFVEDFVDPSAHGRERWWRAVRRDLRFPPRSEQSDRMRAVVDEVNRLAFAADLEAFDRAQTQYAQDENWVDALPHSRGSIHVTPAELAEFFEEYIGLLNRYKRTGPLPPDARTVLTRFVAFPAPDAVPGDGDGDGDGDANGESNGDGDGVGGEGALFDDGG